MLPLDVSPMNRKERQNRPVKIAAGITPAASQRSLCQQSFFCLPPLGRGSWVRERLLDVPTPEAEVPPLTRF